MTKRDCYDIILIQLNKGLIVLSDQGGSIMIYENDKAAHTIEPIENEQILDEAKKDLGIRPKNFQQKYIVPHLESYLWDQSLKELISNGKASAAMQIIAENGAQLYYLDYKIGSLVKAMGTTGEEETKMKLYRDLFKMDEDVRMIRINHDGLRLDRVDGTTIRAKVLSDVMPNLFEGDDIIKTTKRGKHNSFNTINISSHLYMDNKVVSGYIYGLSSKSRYLHSWVETVLDGEEVVIDYSMNTIMNRDGYYELRKAEPISKIKKSELIEDGPIVYPYIQSGDLTYKEYLTCRKEVMENIANLQSEN